MKKINMSKLKIFNLIALAVSLVFVLISSIGSVMNSQALLMVCSLSLIAAMLAGGIYCLLGYSKKAAVFYKILMILFMLSEGLAIVYSMSAVQTQAYTDPFLFSTSLYGGVDQTAVTFAQSALILSASLYVLALILETILCVGKDLGKIWSGLLVAVVFVCKFVILIGHARLAETFGDDAMAIMSSDIARIIVALTICVAVIGKYRDKAARGRDT